MRYSINITNEEVSFTVRNSTYASKDKDIMSDQFLDVNDLASTLATIDDIRQASNLQVGKIVYYSDDSNMSTYELKLQDDEFNKSSYSLSFYRLSDGLKVFLSTSNVDDIDNNSSKVFETSNRKVNVRMSIDGSQFSTRMIEVESANQICLMIDEIITLHLMSMTVEDDVLENSSFWIYRINDRSFRVNYLDEIEFDLDFNKMNLFMERLKSDPNSVELLFETARHLRNSTSYDIVIDIPRTLTRLVYLKGSQNSEFSVRLAQPTDRSYSDNAGTIHVSVMQKNRQYRRLYYKDESQKVKIFTDMRTSEGSKIEFCRKTEYFTALSAESAQQFVRDSVESMQALNRAIDLYASSRIVKGN